MKNFPKGLCALAFLFLSNVAVSDELPSADQLIDAINHNQLPDTGKVYPATGIHMLYLTSSMPYRALKDPLCIRNSMQDPNGNFFRYKVVAGFLAHELRFKLVSTSSETFLETYIVFIDPLDLTHRSIPVANCEIL
jgi:hypothetical protein